MKQIIAVHCTSSSRVTFECDDAMITGSAEPLMTAGALAGMVVSSGSLQYPDGRLLSPEERQSFLTVWREYLKQPRPKNSWTIEIKD